MSASSASLLTGIVVGIAIFGLGYMWNAFRGARILLKGAKASVPKMRQTYWHNFWRMIRWGIGAVIVAIVLVAWTVRDAQTAEPAPSPAPSVTPR